MTDRIMVFRFRVFDLASNDYAYSYATRQCLADNKNLVPVNDPEYPSLLVPLADVNKHGFYRHA